MALENNFLAIICRFLTSSCQSGAKAGAFAGLLSIVAAVPAGAGPTGWAHQAAGFQSNGAVTVKSLAGGSYTGTQNPTGAVAKVNQSAATQAPTVIIQATSGAYAEAIPLTAATTTPPTCPAGYNRIFTAYGTGCPSSDVYNVGGTRFSLVVTDSSGGGYNTNYVAWTVDNEGTNKRAIMPSQYAFYGAPVGLCRSGGISIAWSAALCTK